MSQVIDKQDNSTAKPLALLKKHGMSVRGVARGLGYSDSTVRDVLDPGEFGRVSHRKLIRARNRIEALLSAAGEDVTDLWAEYDSQLEDAA